MKVVHTARHRGHAPTVETYLGLPVPANEVPARAEIIAAALAADGFEIIEPTSHGEAPILAVHDERLLRFLEEAWAAFERQRIERDFLTADTYPSRAMFEGMSPELVDARPEPVAAGGRAGWWGLDSGNPITAGTYDAARGAADVALSTLDLVLAGDRAAYGLCRPPGHHAARALAGGYCFFNNAAIAADAAVRATGGGRVAILDVDVHHGNGSQQIFWRRPDVLYASLHVDPRYRYPFFLGHADEVGEGPGRGANLNLPLPEKTTDAAYLDALDSALEAIAAHRPELLVVSLGFDTYELDPIGGLRLTTAAYGEVGRRVAALARPLVILQEGGYHRPSLGVNAVAWLRGAAGMSGPT